VKGLSAQIPPQATQIYQVLLDGGEMTATDIGRSLHIWPHSVYRALKPLINLGCVIKNRNQPATFKAIAPQQAVNLFLAPQKDWFLSTFSQKENIILEQPGITFLNNRNELLDTSIVDQRGSRKKVCLVVSGDEIPAELVLENTRAIKRGVSIRLIVQRIDKDNLKMIHNWIKNGLKVKFYPSVNSRIIIIDSCIVFVTSYNPTNKDEALGVRFVYPPFGKIMSDFFNQIWVQAKPVPASLSGMEDY